MNEPSPAGSTRTCVGCGQRAERRTLLGLFFAPVGKVSGAGVGDAGGDAAGEAFVVTLPGAGRPAVAGGGRGVHVHGVPRCLEGASRKGLSRVLRRPVRVSVAELKLGVTQALGRQVGATLRAARRQKMLSVVEVTAGPSVTAATAEPSGGTTDAPLLWVHAIDAGASGGREASAGQVQAGTRRQLGALVDRPEVPLIALRDRQLASRLQQACALASAVAIGGLEVG